jgi:hypothetical protein
VAGERSFEGTGNDAKTEFGGLAIQSLTGVQDGPECIAVPMVVSGL